VTFKSSAVKLYVEFECQNVFDVQERARGPLSCSRGGVAFCGGGGGGGAAKM